MHAPVNSYKCMACDEEFSDIDYLNEHCKKFLHSNAEETKRVYTAKKLYAYPHMQLNVSAFDTRVLDSIRMYMCDYGKTKLQIIRDIKDHIVFDKQDDSPRRSKKQNNEEVTDEEEIDLSLYEQKLETIYEDDSECHDYNEYEFSVKTGEKKEIEIEKLENNEECEGQSNSHLYEASLETVGYDSNDCEGYENVEELSPPVKRRRKK